MEVHRELKNTRHQTLVHSFAKYLPIFKTLLPYTQQEISSKATIKDSATFQKHRCTTL